MKQHGFGRNKAWAVVEKKPDAVTVQLKPDAETRAQYPYDFLAEQTCTVLPRGLQVDLLIANHGDKPMPVSPGWHPYYCCNGAQKGQVTGDVSGLSADKLGNDKEFDFGLPAPMLGRGHFNVPGLGKLTVKFTPVMRHMQFWSQPGKDFICIEPFFGPNNTVNTEKRYDIPPKAARVFWMRIEID
jgi:galactose mutarotase-like enzyme